MNRKKMETPARKGGASALLQRANAQLRGQRVPVAQKLNTDEDDIGAYLSSLNKKTQKQPQWDKFGDESDIDISLSSNDEPENKQPSVASKFLKKKVQADKDDTDIKNKAPKFLKKPEITIAPKSSTSTALSKAAQFMSKFSYEKKKETVVLSDSDLDMDLSLDSDVMADVHAMKEQPSPMKDKIEKSTKTYETKDPPRPQSRLSGPPVKNERNFSKNKRVTSPVTGDKKEGKKRDSYGIDISESSSSDIIGKGGSKFLKKKTVEKAASPPPTPVRSPETPKRDIFRLKSSDKYATHVVLDTDEESLADFIGGLSGSTDPGSARTPRGRLSPQQATPKQFLKPRMSPVEGRSPEPAFGAIQEVEEMSDQNDISENLSVEEDSFKFNVMGIDALGPVLDLEPAGAPKSPDKKKTTFKLKSPSSPKVKKKKASPRETKKRGKEKKKKPEEASPFFSSMGLQSVDELFGVDADTSEASEVPSEEPEMRSPTPLRSILSPTSRSQTPRRVRLSLGEIHEIRSRSPSPEPISTGRALSSRIYTEEFEDEEHTDTAVSIHSSDSDDSIETITDTGRSSPSRSRKSSLSRQRSIEDYSDDFTETSAASRWRSHSSRSSSHDSATYSDDYTSYVGSSDKSRSPSPESPRYRTYRPETRSIRIQTSEMPGLWYHWNTDDTGRASMSQPLGLNRVDPTPIASHVVSADALEAMTAYSPCVMALNDMLRQQLQLTRQFVETQKRMHRAYIGSSIPDHNYTTLAETKKYISKHRKPKLTFDEALRQVKEEMELE